MIVHVVAFKFKTGVSWQDPRAAAAERVTHEHPRHIPEISHWTVGRNISERPVAYDFAVIGHFTDRARLDRYLVHPDHQRGVRAWREIGTWIVVDLETDSPPTAAALGLAWKTYRHY